MIESPNSSARIGIISDTHGLMRPEALAALTGSDLILHAGDIGDPEILETLETIAPVVAVRGNNDKGDWATAIPEQKTVQVGDLSIHLLHILPELRLNLAASNIRVVVSGHSHKPRIAEQEGVLFINPGSAGPRRFKLPISVAQLHVDSGDLQATIVELI